MTMKIFQTLEKNMAVIGFTPTQHPNNNRQLNSRQIISVAVDSISTISFLMYTIFEANSIEEYIVSNIMLTAGFTFTTSYINTIFQNDKIFDTIEMCEKELNLSK